MSKPIRPPRRKPSLLFWVCGAVCVMIGVILVAFVLWAETGTGRGVASRAELRPTEVFRDADLLISQPIVSDSQVVASTTVLGLVIENRSAGKIHYLPLWDEPQECAILTDEYGNVFRPNGRRYWRSPRKTGPGTNAPQPNGNIVSPGANDAFVLEFHQIPPSSKRFRVELPYREQSIVFIDVPRR